MALIAKSQLWIGELDIFGQLAEFNQSVSRLRIGDIEGQQVKEKAKLHFAIPCNGKGKPSVAFEQFAAETLHLAADQFVPVEG
jgi:hypothetical protein